MGSAATSGPNGTAACRGARTSPALFRSCCTQPAPPPLRLAHALQWWGWALQTSFVLLTAAYWAAKSRNAGVLIIGACATVLGEL